VICHTDLETIPDFSFACLNSTREGEEGIGLTATGQTLYQSLLVQDCCMWDRVQRKGEPLAKQWRGFDGIISVKAASLPSNWTFSMCDGLDAFLRKGEDVCVHSHRKERL
jgi:hypothetical protein